MSIFAEVGSSLQQVGGSCPEGWVEMRGQRTDNSFVAHSDGTWGLPIKTEAELAAEVRQALTAAVQSFLDTAPRARGYDGILSLCTYATSTSPRFQPEGQAGVEWRDAVWAKAHDIEEAVMAGTRLPPSEEELVEELPPMVWP